MSMWPIQLHPMLRRVCSWSHGLLSLPTSHLEIHNDFFNKGPVLSFHTGMGLENYVPGPYYK